MKLHRLLACGLSLLVATIPFMSALAQDYPHRPIKVVVGYAPGGGTDIFARVIADKLGRVLGQPIIVENKAGANGNIAADQVAKSPADGYSLLFVVNTHVTNVDMYASLSYDPIKDFSPVGLVVSTPLLLVATPSFAPNNIHELLAFAKSNPGKATFATPGIGSPAHLTIEMLKASAGVDIQVIHYKGAGPAQTDVMAGHVNMQIPTLAQALPQEKANKLKLLAQTGLTRSALAPDLSTIAEQGMPGFQSSIWFALLAPSATPQSVMTRLNRALNEALTAPDTVAKLREMGGDPMGGTQEQAAKLMLSDQVKWRKVIKEVGIKPQ
jgi:tripartite-type tricarboxylate transporter receptor subunit TctC